MRSVFVDVPGQPRTGGEEGEGDDQGEGARGFGFGAGPGLGFGELQTAANKTCVGEGGGEDQAGGEYDEYGHAREDNGSGGDWFAVPRTLLLKVRDVLRRIHGFAEPNPWHEDGGGLCKLPRSIPAKDRTCRRCIHK